MNLNIVVFAVIILFLQHSLTSYGAAGKEKGEGGACYSAIYSFGDSLADTGNLLVASGGDITIGNLPYGETYFGKGSGRFSDGRLIVDYIAQAFGLPFLDPYLKIKNSSNYSGTGVNFAVAGATALKPAFFKAKNIGPLLTPFSLDTQIHWFLLHRRKFCTTFLGDCNKHFENALFLMGEIGGNDYNYPFFEGRSMQEVYTWVHLVVDKIVKALNTLITVGGAKKILVQNNLPIGCSPSYLTRYASSEALDKMGCMTRFNSFAKKGNDLLKARVEDLQEKYPQVRFVFADYYGAALRVIQSPQSFGLQKNVLVTCCGAGGPYKFNPGMWCGVGSAVPCVNPAQYFNWDGVHLTDSAYGNIARLFLDGTFTTPPLQNSVCKMPAAKPTLNVNATMN